MGRFFTVWAAREAQVPHGLITNQKISILKCNLLLFYATTLNHFSIRLWFATKGGFYMTTSGNQLVVRSRRSSKALPKVKFSIIKGHGRCLVVCCWSDSLQLSESQCNCYIWEVCSANQWDALKTAMPAAGTGEQKGPNSSPPQSLTACLTNNTSKVEWIGLQCFASSTIFTWPLANGHHFFKDLDNFSQNKWSHSQ